MAAVLASGPDALLSHQTAAALWGLRGYSGGAIHVTVPRKSTSPKRIRRHLSHVPPDERTLEEGIPVTSVHRTIFDLAATASLDDVVAMIKEAEYLNGWDRLSLPDLLERYPGKRGSRRFNDLISLNGVIHLTWAQLDSEPEAIASDLRRVLLGDR